MCKKTTTRAVLTLAAVAMVILVLTTTAANASEAELVSALTALKNHIEGTAPLDASQIEAHKLTIDSNSQYMGNSSTVIAASFDLVAAYDSIIGPLFVSGSPIQSFKRSGVSDTDIHWAVYNVMQYIIDYSYTSETIASHPTLINGNRFH